MPVEDNPMQKAARELVHGLFNVEAMKELGEQVEDERRRAVVGDDKDAEAARYRLHDDLFNMAPPDVTWDRIGEMLTTFETAIRAPLEAEVARLRAEVEGKCEVCRHSRDAHTDECWACYVTDGKSYDEADHTFKSRT